MDKVVIADDDTELATIIAQRLSNEKFKCLVTHDGREAYDMIKRELPDLVILDIMLPHLSGYEVCRRARRDPQLYATPILVLTGLRDEPEVVHALEQGADDLVAKPFRFDNLIQKARALLAMGKSLDEVDPVIGMVGTDAIKRHVNHRLARDEHVAVCYVDILHIQPFRHVYGAERYTEVLKLTAEILEGTRTGLTFFDSFLGHMGGTDFVAVLTMDQYEPYCRTVLSSFEQRIPTYYRAVERKQGYVIYRDGKGRESKAPLMHLSVGVVHNQHRKFHGAQEVWEALRQMKSWTRAEPNGGLFVDRRRTER